MVERIGGETAMVIADLIDNQTAVGVKMGLSTHKGKVGSSVETWSVTIPQKYTNAILSVAPSGDVYAVLVPAELVEGTLVDTETGEIL
jgi:hypothetical protein